MNEILAIIPARGGSKGLPGKNIKPMNGKPLIFYTIKSALESKSINKIIVSTDSKKIAEISKKNGAEILLRPQELASDDVPIIPVVKHVIREVENMGHKFNIVVVLQPTSPLINSEYIENSIKKLIETKSDFVATVTEVDHHPYRMRKFFGDKIVPFIENKDIFLQRQDLPKVYRLNGAVVVGKAETFLKQGNNYNPNSDWRGVIMKQEDSIDIDTELDFLYAELIMRNRLI